MKKKLIFLFAVIIAACSDSDMSGYTDSIIKDTSSTNLENTFLQKTSDTKESNSSLEEELLGLDDEELREKLIKTYPWPNVQRVQGVNNTSEAGSSSSSENPGSSSSEIHYSETLPIPHDPYTGEIKPYIMKENVSYITKGKNHLYGFDGLTNACFQNDVPQNCYLEIDDGISKTKTTITYISVKQWETAYFAPHNFKNQKEARIIHEKKYVEEDGELKLVDVHPGENLSDVAEKTTDEDKQLIDKKTKSDKEQCAIKVKSLADAGIYGIYVYKSTKGNNKISMQTEATDKWVRVQFIKVIPYDEITKHIALVVLNGDKGDELDPEGETCDKGFSERGITKACLTKNFNEVYNQAVMKVDVTQELAKDYGITDMIEVWMNDLNQTNKRGYYALHKSAQKKFKDSEATTKDASGNYNLKDPHWHIIFAINKVRKIWELGKCKDHQSYDLLSCQCSNNNANCKFKIRPSLEQQVSKNGITKIQYYIGEISPDHDDLGYKKLKRDPKNGNIIKTPVELRMTQTKEKNTKYKSHLYIFKEGEDNPYQFKKDDVLFTENGFPIVPRHEFIKGELVAVHEQASTGDTDDDKEYLFDEYLPFGGVVYAPGIAGTKKAYYILLHELGHSFGLTDVSSTDIYPSEKVLDDNNGKIYHYTNNNGEEYLDKYYFWRNYASSETNLMAWQEPMGSKLQYRETQIVCTAGYKYYEKPANGKSEVYLGTLEARIPNGFEPHQWECIRGNCYDQNFSDTYTTQERKYHFVSLISEAGPCTEKKHVVKREEYDQKLEEFNKSKYLK